MLLVLPLPACREGNGGVGGGPQLCRVPLRGTGLQSGGTREESSGARQPTDSRSVLRPSASDIPTTYQPVDWSSDEGARVDGSARRIAINLAIGGNATAPTDTESTPSLPGSAGGGNSFRSNSGTKQETTSSGQSVDTPPTPPGDTTVHPLTLYGKDILRIFPFGTTESAADAVKWSDALGAVDTEDDFSIRDPHFDLTNAKITKLFALSKPNGRRIIPTVVKVLTGLL
ncbi:hypothetical protein PF008_g20605 [Phytophthora fragariae]|uniref:Uncharacterized protein n=1 Tax=Phytophthora fragariae TaxID=53985 RepID=A0A6G0QZ89_9STRA|nr:hypothetical protein PF008_g20605 [Phytophthora fragariae]